MTAAIVRETTTADDQPEERGGGFVPVAFWLLSFVMIVAESTPRLLSQAVVIPAGRSLMSPADTWSPPVSRIEVWKEFLALPGVVVALLGGIVVALISQHAVTRHGFWTGFVAAIALSVGLREVHLITAALLLGIAIVHERERSGSSDLKNVVVRFMIIALGIATTLEFGFLILFWSSLSLPYFLQTSGRRNARNIWMFAGGVTVLLALCVLYSGFQNVLLRPFNWWTVATVPGLLDSLNPAISRAGVSWADGLLLTVIGLSWFRAANCSRGFQASLACLLIFTCLGILCSYYLWLSTIAVVLGSGRETPAVYHKRIHGLAIFGALLYGVLQLSGPGTDVREYLTQDTLPARRIDPSEWDLKGPVMLLDLDRSSEWQMPGEEQEFQLVLDDRWEICREGYPQYAALVRDLREMRAMIYLKTDLQFGGFRHQLKPWDPMVVVAESSDLDAIRTLSLSPHWKLMGIDAQTTIFGKAGSSDTLPQIQIAGDHLLTLEWPNRDGQLRRQNVVAASTPAELQQVSAVLVAIRLPYAALRLLPSRSSVSEQKTRTACYLELAHRTFRNTGHQSLLDCFRAATMIRRVEDRGGWSPEEKNRLSRSLRGLELGDLSEELFPTTGNSDSGLSETPSRAAASEQGASSDVDVSIGLIRKEVLRGHAELARKQIGKIPHDVQAFFEVILSSMDRSREELAHELYRISESQKMPRPMQAELLFYLGCVAIEFGDRNVAINALSQSEQLDPQSNWTPLRMLYLQHLRRP